MNKKALIINNKFNIKNSNGITLITLIITIILLLILAGIVINLSIGQNGIFNRTKQAKGKYEEVAEKEKLQAVLVEAAIQKETNMNYNNKEFLNNMLEENGMKVNGDLVIVEKYNFSIDRDKLEIIINENNNELCKIEVTYIGTTSFRVNISKVYNEEEVKEYIYIIDGSHEKVTTEKECTKENLLPETNHIANVIVKYNDGKTITSNTINLKLKPRTYLFKEGDECIDITGGWKAIAIIDPESQLLVGGEAVIPDFTLNKEKGYMNLYLNSTKGLQAGGLIINNKIDYTKYKKFCVEIIASLGEYNSSTIVSIYNNISKPTEGPALCYSIPITEKKVVKMETKNKEDIFLYIQSHKNNGEANCNIYNVWLEK